MDQDHRDPSAQRREFPDDAAHDSNAAPAQTAEGLRVKVSVSYERRRGIQTYEIEQFYPNTMPTKEVAAAMIELLRKAHWQATEDSINKGLF